MLAFVTRHTRENTPEALQRWPDAQALAVDPELADRVFVRAYSALEDG